MSAVASDEGLDAKSALERFLAGESSGLADVDAERLFLVGALNYQHSRFADAAEMFRALVLARPRSVRAWASLAMCHDAVEDFDRAASLYTIALCAPVDEGYRERATIYLSRTLYWLEQYGRAAEQLDAVGEVELVPELEDLRTELRALLDARGAS